MFLTLYLVKTVKSPNETGRLTVYCGQGQPTFPNQCQLLLSRVTQKGLGKTLKNPAILPMRLWFKELSLEFTSLKIEVEKKLKNISVGSYSLFTLRA